MLKHVSCVDVSCDSAMSVGKRVAKTDRGYDVSLVLEYTMNMAGALWLTDAKPIGTPGTGEAWDSHGAEDVGECVSAIGPKDTFGGSAQGESPV